MAELAALADDLNKIRGTYVFATTIANRSGAMADEVIGAIAVLMNFFDERKKACLKPVGHRPVIHPITGRDAAEIIESEKGLRARFYDFLHAMKAHDFQLDMDGALSMPLIENWHDLALIITSAFKACMRKNNGFHFGGQSNDGPLPRFVAAVIPAITGENPSVGSRRQVFAAQDA